jgi:hypothetical protein
MQRLTSRNLLLPLLALGLGLSLAATASAQTYVQASAGSPSLSMQISFGTQPRWTTIHGMGVREVYGPGRPDYDMFSYGGTYYVCSDNQWYASRRSSGRFYAIETRSVPRQFSSIPRSHWRHYPNTWSSQNDYGHQGNQGHKGQGNGPDGNGPPGHHKNK